VTPEEADRCFDAWEFTRGLCFEFNSGRSLDACLKTAQDNFTLCLEGCPPK